MTDREEVVCPYCSASAQLCTGSDIYPDRPDLENLSFYRCKPCKAWVGCHPGTDHPLGRLANARLRALKRAVHVAFDPLWRMKAGLLRPRDEREEARRSAYLRLAGELGISPAECDVGMFDEERCERALHAIHAWKNPEKAG